MSRATSLAVCPRSGWTMLLTAGKVKLVPLGCASPQPAVVLGGREKDVCAFHLSSFGTTAESAWCLGANFLLWFDGVFFGLVVFFSHSCSHSMLWLVICRDCRHKVCRNTYGKTIDGSDSVSRERKSDYSPEISRKLFTWTEVVYMGADWCKISLSLGAVWISVTQGPGSVPLKLGFIPGKVAKMENLSFHSLGTKTCLCMVTTAGTWEQTPFIFPLTKA